VNNSDRASSHESLEDVSEQNVVEKIGDNATKREGPIRSPQAVFQAKPTRKTQEATTQA
jgi:hypothetical protein